MGETPHTTEELAHAVIARAIEREVLIGTAESCTGGLVCGALTSVAGSSAVVRGGVCSYAVGVKEDVLGVEPALIERFGVVSEQVAWAMALGAVTALGCELAVSTTGIAGPGGAEPGKPVGTVCIAVAGPDGVRSHTIHAEGDRAAVRAEAVRVALADLLEELSN